MLTVRLPKDLESSLLELASKLGINKSKMVVEALQHYMEDKKDYLLASKIYKAQNKFYTHEEVLSELGL